jgi:hypothetical protein
VEEARVEGVARARRVAAAAGDGERGRLDEDAAVVDDRAAPAQSHADHGVGAQERLRGDERRALVSNAREPARELLRRDEHVDVRQEFRQPLVDVVDVDGDDGAGGARLSGQARTGARVVRVHVE